MRVKHVLKTKWPSSVMEPHSNLCQLPAEIAAITLLVSLLFTPVTTGQHPYMQIVSVLCKPVSSIPTSLSFFKSFYPCFSPFFTVHQLNY